MRRQPKDAQKAARWACLAERAKGIVPQLRRGGTYIPFTHDGIQFDICKQAYTGRSSDETWYRVHLTDEKCDCPDFDKHKDACKHIMAIEMMLDEIAQEEAMLMLADTMQRQSADAECATGCDAHYWLDLRYTMR